MRQGSKKDDYTSGGRSEDWPVKGSHGWHDGDVCTREIPQQGEACVSWAEGEKGNEPCLGKT